MYVVWLLRSGVSLSGAAFSSRTAGVRALAQTIEIGWNFSAQPAHPCADARCHLPAIRCCCCASRNNEYIFLMFGPSPHPIFCVLCVCVYMFGAVFCPEAQAPFCISHPMRKQAYSRARVQFISIRRACERTSAEMRSRCGRTVWGFLYAARARAHSHTFVRFICAKERAHTRARGHGGTYTHNKQIYHFEEHYDIYHSCVLQTRETPLQNSS